MLKIGWSKRDVTTEDPVCIPGQMHCRISEGVQDPILLTCLVMDDGNDCVIFLSGDFVGADGVIDTVREKILAQRTDIPVVTLPQSMPQKTGDTVLPCTVIRFLPKGGTTLVEETVSALKQLADIQ